MNFPNSVAETERPTTSIYFSDCMKSFIGLVGDASKPVWRLTANAFYIPPLRDGEKAKAIILRAWSATAKQALSELPEAEIHYVIDDDLEEGIRDKGLQIAYRRRLLRLHTSTTSKLLRLAKHVYVPSEVLRQRLLPVNPSVTLIQPTLLHPVSSLDHHCENKSIRIIFPGSRSHISSLRDIAVPLKQFLKKYPGIHLTTYLGKHAPKVLRLQNAEHRDTLNWSEYRETLKSDSFHIAILPGRDSRFDQARSRNKILECGMLGAMPVVDIRQPYSGLLQDADAGLVYHRETDDLLHILESLVNDKKTLRDMAARTSALAGHLGDPANTRNFWLERLGINIKEFA